MGWLLTVRALAAEQVAWEWWRLPVVDQPRYGTSIPPQITVPDVVQTRLGTLRFTDGFPDEQTVAKVLDNLDFQRGVQAFLAAMPAASLAVMRRALRAFGPDNQTVVIFGSLMDSRSLFLTPNTETVYAFAWLNLSGGPVVVQAPAGSLGLVDDFWFHYVADIGLAGPDRGQGGRFLFVRPGYAGDLPAEGYYVCRSGTFNNWLALRGFLHGRDPAPAVAAIRERLRIYPFGGGEAPMTFVDGSGQDMNTIHAMDFSFFQEVNEVVQDEPNAAIDPETLGLLASIGIEKGKPFAPDERMRATLAEAAAVAAATARANAYRSRLADAFFYPGSAWCTPFVGGSYLFERDGVRLLDARSMMFFAATGITPAMTIQQVGAGSAYAAAFVDADGHPLDGARTYRLHLPAGIPARAFWSVVLYDTQTRSMLQTDQLFPSTGSQNPALQANPDGSCDLYFAPAPPAG